MLSIFRHNFFLLLLEFLYLDFKLSLLSADGYVDAWTVISDKTYDIHVHLHLQAFVS